MKWKPKDIEMYISSKEYVDTVLLPLTGVDFGGGILQSASMNDFLMILTNEIEKQFKGRVLLLPPIAYGSSWTREEKRLLIEKWKGTLEAEEFRHLFFLTCDAEWKVQGSLLGDSLLWVPPLPLEHMDDKHKGPLMEEQVSQTLKKIVENWKKD